MKLKVTRTIEIEGEASWVMNALEKSLVNEARQTFTCPYGEVRLMSEKAECTDSQQ